MTRTRTRTLAAGLTGALLLAGVFTGVATAAEVGPETQACVTAQAGVRLKAESAFKATEALEAASSSLSDAQRANIAKLQDEFSELQTKLDAALTALRIAPSAANAAEAQRLGALLNTKATALATADGANGLGTATQALIDANAALEAALAVQAKACTAPVVTTTTPAASTSASPSTSASAPVSTTSAPPSNTPIDVNADGFSQVDDIPTAIDTGRA